jgi:hypothetical protein
MPNFKHTNIPPVPSHPFFFPALAAAALHLEAPGVKEKWVFPSKYPLFANPENPKLQIHLFKCFSPNPRGSPRETGVVRTTASIERCTEGDS